MLKFSWTQVGLCHKSSKLQNALTLVAYLRSWWGTVLCLNCNPFRIVTLHNLPRQKPGLPFALRTPFLWRTNIRPKLAGRCEGHASGTWKAFGYLGCFSFLPDLLKFSWLTLKQASWGPLKRTHVVTQTYLCSAAPQASAAIFPRSTNHLLCMISPIAQICCHGLQS